VTAKVSGSLLTVSLQIEVGNDPRDNVMSGGEHDEDDESLPELEEALPHMHPLHDHNPWQDDDPDDSDISTMRFQPMGPNRFHVSATIHRTISPAALGQNGNGPNTIGGITSFLTNLLQGQGARQTGGPQDPIEESRGNMGSRPSEDGQPHVHRFTYSGGARLHPRDTNNPEPRLEPVDDISRYVF
jgi:E3 ubiquitin-protein ligase RNF115/126